MEAKGYYSLVQYCPDHSRAEVANVGVLLFCPERGFLQVRMAHDNKRVKRFFRQDGVDIDRKRLNAAKSAILSRLQVAHDEFKCVEDLCDFAKSRANEIVITQPRSMRVTEPERELDELFAELVG